MSQLILSPDVIVQTLASFASHKKFLIAYSGGLDSHVLLHLMAGVREITNCDIRAIYVNHGLQKEAEAWGQHCQKICKELSIPCDIVKLNLRHKKGKSLEALARDARYQSLAESLQTDEVLLTAQHLNDQAETLLLQLFRGAGVDGLASMPRSSQFGKGQHIRPLLDFSRLDLQHYAEANQLRFIEDPSNQDQRFDRNFLRMDIMPQLEQRWQGISKVLSRVAQHQGEAKAILDELAAGDLQALQTTDKDQLLISKLLKLSRQRQKLVLRYWIKQQGFLQPSAKKFEHLFRDVIYARSDAIPVLSWFSPEKSIEIRRYQDRLYIMEALPVHDYTRVIPWDLKQPLSLEEIGVTLYPEGIKDLLPNAKGAVTVRFRQGGEKIYSPKLGKHISVKKLFQGSDVPPWLRSRVPLVYQGEQLVYVFGFPIINNIEENI